jgi:class 3 adenylate cyclase
MESPLDETRRLHSDTSVTPPIRAVLFADLSGWTDLTSRIGDEAALALRDELFGPLMQIIAGNRGAVVKTLGDGLMCVFDSAPDAARAAREMQRHAERANREAAEALPMRIGIHAGQVVLKDNDIEGNTVNIAARVVAASRPERILMTRVTAERLTEDLARLIRSWRTEKLKGRSETFDLLELNWRETHEQRTIVARHAAELSGRFTRLTLRCQDKECVLEPGGRPLTFGRSPHNALVIEDPLAFVSGSHGRIEVNGGGVMLTDNSRNGIYVAFGRGQFFLVDKSVVLRGSGQMTIGRSPNDPGAIIAEFELE